MFDTLGDVQAFYQKQDLSMRDKHIDIYRHFHNNIIQKEPKLAQAFHAVDGFGELPFQWNWYLAVKDAPTEFKFLEVGVYKGRVLATIQYLANLFGKRAQIYGVTPLSGTGDKYSGYQEVDYFEEIRNAYAKTHNVSFANTKIIKGFSQDPLVVQEAVRDGPYNILFIDGCHDYEVVCQDIANYVPLLKQGGLLVMDDASLFLESPAGQFHGHPDVGRAIRDHLDSRPDIQHVYAVGHNRVWRKL